jgi:hypothetical protein
MQHGYKCLNHNSLVSQKKVITKTVIIKAVYFGMSAHLLKTVQRVLHQCNLIAWKLVDLQDIPKGHCFTRIVLMEIIPFLFSPVIRYMSHASLYKCIFSQLQKVYFWVIAIWLNGISVYFLCNNSLKKQSNSKFKISVSKNSFI